ncbi:hypothetical protein N7E81_01680 [Reichenbachiella carrageenanivorans]|uniref:Uncharacterized protein n=1 Tax=Reichenbachiella carrageenanivorans TaxID=2979869 RepID=A0ABY6D0V9_9BACT|nr:hypothetical protein [Reichenbachiella carrageenanivorans]UXX79814.1 hypothetical protein N7E81_01680 [Reichenbachiella carrageenanivorans]
MPAKKTIKYLLVMPIGILLLLIVFNNKQLKSQSFGVIKYRDFEMAPGNVAVPYHRTLEWEKESAFADSIYQVFADMPITEEMLWRKGATTRILLARLMLKQNVSGVNEILQKMTVWGNCGSSWFMNPKGDYDFPLTILTTIFWKFGDQPDVIYPDTKKHLLNVLLSEDGGKFSYTAPKTLGLVFETENHMLMTEGSRYLKNRWIRQHGNSDSYYDNVQNGMEEKLLSLMNEMKTNGLYEFNSIPYIGYTITALLNLEAFAAEKVSKTARDVLDYINWSYALSSFNLKHFPPMRRRYEKASIQELTTDYHSGFIKSWLSYSDIKNYDKNIGAAGRHALMGAVMPYRPSDRFVEMLFEKQEGYFVRQGHGPEGSPEISSAGKHFMISAGGVNRGKKSQIVARPICLFLDDRTDHLSEVFHLSGPGDDFMQWNNTGVYKKFACAAGPVSIPKDMQAVAKSGNWSCYTGAHNISIVVFSENDLGILVVFEDVDPSVIFEEVLKSNPNAELLAGQFKFPDGSWLKYDVKAEKNQWVMKSEDGQSLDRDFDSWPLIEGKFNNVD